MAVTLYRCSQCNGVFSAVYDAGPNRKLCRGCKFSGFGASSDAAKKGEEVTIVEPDGKGESVGAGKQGVQSAIGGPIGNAQDIFAQQNVSGLMGQVGAGAVNASLQTLNDMTNMILDNVTLLTDFVGAKVYDPSTNSFYEKTASGTIRQVDGIGKVIREIYSGGNEIRTPFQYAQPESKTRTEVPRPDPHEATLNPKRKIRLEE